VGISNLESPSNGMADIPAGLGAHHRLLGHRHGVGFGSRQLALAFIPPSEREEAHSIAAALMTAFAAGFVLLTALTLANEATALSSAQSIVSTEAADASSLAWASTNPGVNAGPIQVALRNYLQATRTF
jgi:hypothetical protein